MHLGNIFTALMSYLSVRKSGGQWVLRIEDLDPQRSKVEYARQIEDDLHWLGLEWDEGGLDGGGANGPYEQSLRGDIYARYYKELLSQGVTYPCYCRRADILATQAPHQTDGRVVYSGACRPSDEPPFVTPSNVGCRAHSTRLFTPDREVCFEDVVFGLQSANVADVCGDFILRRADGAWAYQLAVVVDDALMGITEVVRGCDLLLSTTQQLYLYDLLGFDVPRFAHLPLICNDAMQRLSKRDRSASMEELRKKYSPEEIYGVLGYAAGLLPERCLCRLDELIEQFDWQKVRKEEKIKIEEA
ncbi:MAG: tRNA glutamyl-Q(34) synthetase GluQRS [Muribaculaceae bacterium]|nr:tRNA glutamyl-Q(34) synthetase GluQRS [Muribaculaceae bacterium]